MSARLDRARSAVPVGAITSTTADLMAATFDDGPDRRFTPRVLEVLAAHDARATFFVLLTKIRRDPELIGQVLAAGHEIGLHGPDHRRITELPHAEAVSTLRSARAELEELSGAVVRWYRPPYGAQHLGAYLAARRAGLTPVLWSATTWDWKNVPQEERLATALRGARPGAIMLAHDGIVGAEDGAPDETRVECDRIGLLDDVLSATDVRGLRVGTVGEALVAGRALRTLRFVVRPTGYSY